MIPACLVGNGVGTVEHQLWIPGAGHAFRLWEAGGGTRTGNAVDGFVPILIGGDDDNAVALDGFADIVSQLIDFLTKGELLDQ